MPKQYLKGQDVLDDGSARYMASFVDLNDDGQKEVIVHVISQSLCRDGKLPKAGSCLYAVLGQHRKPNFHHPTCYSLTKR